MFFLQVLGVIGQIWEHAVHLAGEESKRGLETAMEEPTVFCQTEGRARFKHKRSNANWENVQVRKEHVIAML